MDFRHLLGCFKGGNVTSSPWPFWDLAAVAGQYLSDVLETLGGRLFWCWVVLQLGLCTGGQTLTPRHYHHVDLTWEVRDGCVTELRGLGARFHPMCFSDNLPLCRMYGYSMVLHCIFLPWVAASLQGQVHLFFAALGFKVLGIFYCFQHPNNFVSPVDKLTNIHPLNTDTNPRTDTQLIQRVEDYTFTDYYYSNVFCFLFFYFDAECSLDLLKSITQLGFCLEISFFCMENLLQQI